MLVVFPFIPMPITIENEYGTDCLLLQFDEGELARFEFDSISSGTCQETFGSKKNFEKFEQLRLAELEKRDQEEIAALVALAEGGGARAQFQVYIQAPPSKQSLIWLCLAAIQGYALAQEEMGDLHVPGRNMDWEPEGLVQPNQITAYLWYSLAASNGLKLGAFKRDSLSKDMTDQEITQAQRLVAEWQPYPAECEVEALWTTN